jgi:MFS family permease
MRRNRTSAAPKRARIFTLPFTLVVLSGTCYFTALAMLTPVLPDYVEKSLDSGSIAVGVAVGAFAVGAILLRPFAGRIGDSVGRRVLIVGGALIVAVTTACYGLVHELWFLVLLRVASGFGEAGFFVGAATMITDLSPPERRGEAVSYWSVAVYGGLSFGPVLGSVLHGHGHYGDVWLVSAALAFAAAFIGLFTVEVPREPSTATGPRHLLHRAAIGPGTVLFLGLIALAGFTAFIPLYVDGLSINAGVVFALYGVLILGVRIFGARVPDRLGGRATATIALTFTGIGIGLIAAWPSVPGLVLGTVVFAGGMSLMYPALLLLALHGVSDAERASVVGTFSSFFDASQGLGALICGSVVAVTGDRGAFTTGAVCAFAGLLVLRGRSWAHTTTPAVT